MVTTRIADDFAAISRRMNELREERQKAEDPAAEQLRRIELRYQMASASAPAVVTREPHRHWS
jgi:hypothetical protein